MSWRTGTTLFWDFWPKIKGAMPDEAARGEFTRDLLKTFLTHDTDPGDLRGRDPEIDRLMTRWILSGE